MLLSHLPFDKMHPEMQPAVFGVAKGMETVSSERGRTASMRLLTSGSRQVVMADFEAVKKHMEKGGLSNITPEQVQNYFKNLSKDCIDHFVASGGTLFAVTTNAQEAVLIPFNWVFAERILTQNDSIGIRVSFFLAGDESRMTDVCRWLQSVKKPNNWLQNGVDAIIQTFAD